MKITEKQLDELVKTNKQDVIDALQCSLDAYSWSNGESILKTRNLLRAGEKIKDMLSKPKVIDLKSLVGSKVEFFFWDDDGRSDGGVLYCIPYGRYSTKKNKLYGKIKICKDRIYREKGFYYESDFHDFVEKVQNAGFDTTLSFDEQGLSLSIDGKSAGYIYPWEQERPEVEKTYEEIVSDGAGYFCRQCHKRDKPEEPENKPKISISGNLTFEQISQIMKAAWGSK